MSLSCNFRKVYKNYRRKLDKRLSYLVLILLSVYVLYEDSSYLATLRQYEINERTHAPKYGNKTVMEKNSREYIEMIEQVPFVNHLSIKYYIGVLTAEKYLQSRAKDAFNTWAGEVENLDFYIGNTRENVQADVPLITLKDVNDTAYPPQQKSFSLLQYWCDYLLDQYDWFIKMDDDAYIKLVLLERFLWTLDPNDEYYIGRPGMGIPEEIILLGMEGNMFCSGPTVIYSKPMLKALCPHIKNCAKNVATIHEDTEIGRCIAYNLGKQCTVNQKPPPLHELFFTSYEEDCFAGNLSLHLKFQKAISVHAVKDSQLFYNIHYYYKVWLNQFIHSDVGKTLPGYKDNVLQLMIRAARLKNPKKKLHKS